jgi:hypothetical protein
MFDINSNLWQPAENVSSHENEDLTKPFLEEEIRHALFQMEKNKATRSDGIPIEFYQVYWAFIKSDICALFEDFYQGTLDIKRLNYDIITLLPKVKEPEKIQQFRLIRLLNCLYKWFTKCLTIRLEPVADRIIHKSQNAFIKGRNIMNGMLALNEILHETKRRGRLV